MSAEAAALQQLRGLIAALGAGELAALSEATVTNLRAAANSVARLARAGTSELARGSWEAALELWCVAPLRERRVARCAAEPWVQRSARCDAVHWRGTRADQAASCSSRARRNVVVALSSASTASESQAVQLAQLRQVARCAPKRCR